VAVLTGKSPLVLAVRPMGAGSLRWGTGPGWRSHARKSGLDAVAPINPEPMD